MGVVLLVVNLFGAPSAGKSSLALLTSALIKMRHPDISVECPNEVAKMLYYDEAPKALKCQLYIAGLQQWQIERCENHVDLVICDSPVLLSSVYGEDTNQKLPQSFSDLCLHYHKKFPSLNYFIQRNHQFEDGARWHSESDEWRLTKKIKAALADIPHETVVSNETTASLIAATAARMVREAKKKESK